MQDAHVQRCADWRGGGQHTDGDRDQRRSEGNRLSATARPPRSADRSSTGVVTAIAVGTCIIATNQAGNANAAAAQVRAVVRGGTGSADVTVVPPPSERARWHLWRSGSNSAGLPVSYVTDAVGV